MDTPKSQEKPQKYKCENCVYITNNKKDYKKHLTTRKHEKISNGSIMEDKKPQEFICICGKKYKNHGGLWKHKKICKNDKDNATLGSSTNTLTVIVSLFQDQLKENKELKELIIEQNKQNLELQKQMIEMAKNKSITMNNSNNTTNNKFNLQFFLNEQCKDALNIMDFVNSLTLQLTDLENVGKLGYSEGISKIFINGLKELDIFKRPIHCSDLKRETLYVKDQNAWEKENEEKAKIKLAIKRIANKNIKQIPDWQKVNPLSQDTTTKKHDEYMKIVGESMGGFNIEEDEKNYNKIIKNIAKEVMIDK